CGFYIRAGEADEAVASSISTQALSYTMKVGARAPLYAVSAGKVMLAELDPQELRRYLAGVVFASVTPLTIRSTARVRQEIEAVKGTGFAYAHDEFTQGITAIATAVRRQGDFAGALNGAVPTVRLTRDRDAEFREALRVAAQAMAEILA